MKEYSFYRVISGNKFFLSYFSATERFQSNQDLIERVDKLLSEVPFIEKSSFLVATELNGNVFKETYFLNEQVFLEAFNEINEICSETFYDLLKLNESALSERLKDELESTSLAESSDDAFTFQEILDRAKNTN